MWNKEYEDVRVISFLTPENEGYCLNGHFNIIPACTKVEAGNRLLCPVCKEEIWKCIKVKVIEKEVTEKKMNDFAVHASKIFTKIPILEGDKWENWPENKVSWNSHSLYYEGEEYKMSEGWTKREFVYWIPKTLTYICLDFFPCGKEILIKKNINGKVQDPDFPINYKEKKMTPEEKIEYELEKFKTKVDELLEKFIKETGFFITGIEFITYRNSSYGKSFITNEYKIDRCEISNIGISD